MAVIHMGSTFPEDQKPMSTDRGEVQAYPQPPGSKSKRSGPGKFLLEASSTPLHPQARSQPPPSKDPSDLGVHEDTGDSTLPGRPNSKCSA